MTEPEPAEEVCRGGDSCVICEYEARRVEALSKFPRKPTPEGPA